MIRSRFVDSSGARIHYLDSGGDGHGAPVIFVPGMTDTVSDYEAALPSFGRRTVVVDLRGHGRSSAPPDGYDLVHLAGDVGAVVDDVTAGSVHVVTFSRGTSCGLAWALDHPARVRSISIGDYPPREVAVPPDAVERLLDATWRGTPVRSRLDEHAARRTFAAARARSFWEPLARLQPPLLVVRGDRNPLVGDDEWARYHATFPSATLVELDDAHHDLFRPDRGRYPRLVRAHIGRAEEAAGLRSS